MMEGFLSANVVRSGCCRNAASHTLESGVKYTISMDFISVVKMLGLTEIVYVKFVRRAFSFEVEGLCFFVKINRHFISPFF